MATTNMTSILSVFVKALLLVKKVLGGYAKFVYRRETNGVVRVKLCKATIAMSVAGALFGLLEEVGKEGMTVRQRLLFGVYEFLPRLGIGIPALLMHSAVAGRPLKERLVVHCVYNAVASFWPSRAAMGPSDAAFLVPLVVYCTSLIYRMFEDAMNTECMRVDVVEGALVARPEWTQKMVSDKFLRGFLWYTMYSVAGIGYACACSHASASLGLSPPTGGVSLRTLAEAWERSRAQKFLRAVLSAPFSLLLRGCVAILYGIGRILGCRIPSQMRPTWKGGDVYIAQGLWRVLARIAKGVLRFFAPRTHPTASEQLGALKDELVSMRLELAKLRPSTGAAVPTLLFVRRPRNSTTFNVATGAASPAVAAPALVSRVVDSEASMSRRSVGLLAALATAYGRRSEAQFWWLGTGASGCLSPLLGYITKDPFITVFAWAVEAYFGTPPKYAHVVALIGFVQFYYKRKNAKKNVVKPVNISYEARVEAMRERVLAREHAPVESADDSDEDVVEAPCEGDDSSSDEAHAAWVPQKYRRRSERLSPRTRSHSV